MASNLLGRLLLGVALATCGIGGVAAAAEPPTRLVVGFQAGGGLDSVARALADALSRSSERRVIVENRPGASGMIAIDALRNAAAGDNLLIILPSGSITMTPHTNRHFSYDPERDLVPVARVATYAMGVAVSPSVGADTLQGYVERARGNEALRAYGTAGVGLSPHFVGVGLSQQAHADLIHVPYRGAGPAINDAVGGQIPAVISTVPSLLAMTRDGRLKLLATSGSERDPNTPQVPTLRELGFKGLDIEEWFGVLAPSGMSEEAARDWNERINAALESEGLRKILLDQGFVPAPMPQAEFRALVNEDYRRWQEVLKDTGDTFAN
ncbi:Bug family tripartite tricarboxylate transporter substrate binding protein [Verticiella sediminum]|nr:tripartite tricarboxylate transporter substrate-binding protein [Verticiella sediminum]